MCRKSEIPDSGLQGNNFLDPPYNISKSCVQPINAIPNLAPIFPFFFLIPSTKWAKSWILRNLTRTLVLL